MPAADSQIHDVTDAQLLDLLQDGLMDMGVELGVAVRSALIAYVRELEHWNTAYNLTAVRDARQMVVKHLLDCLAALPHMEGDSLLDVGSGAGLPGIVVALVRPRVQVSVLEANGKKCAFLRHCLRSLKLTNLRVLQARLEDHAPQHLYQVVTARAFAPLEVFAQSCAHLVADGGRLVALLGQAPDAQLQPPPGFALHSLQAVEVPGLHAERHVAVMTRGLL